MLEDRKKEEAEFHDRREYLRTHDTEKYREMTRNKRFYAITRKSADFFDGWLKVRCRGKQLLDYCCGTGQVARKAASAGAEVTGIDISAESIEQCKIDASSHGLSDRCRFQVMDAEKLSFPAASFDLITCTGVLHHLDIRKAYAELARVLRPGGEVICIEALGHNPVINLYRRMTPNMRTAWEVDHILTKREIDLAGEYFSKVEARFFHLASILAVPFQSTSAFSPVLSLLEAFDDVLLRLPWIKYQAWQVVFTLAGPKPAGT